MLHTASKCTMRKQIAQQIEATKTDMQERVGTGGEIHSQRPMQTALAEEVTFFTVPSTQGFAATWEVGSSSRVK